jgi:hypothetical protein
MTKDEFIGKYANELSGFCVEAFLMASDEIERSKDDKQSMFTASKKGEFMVKQLRRVRELLGRIHDDMEVKQDKPLPKFTGGAK